MGERGSGSCGCQAEAVRRHQIVSEGVQAQYGSDPCKPAYEQAAKAAGLDMRVDEFDAFASAHHRGAIRGGHARSPLLECCRFARPFGRTQVQAMRGDVLPIWLDGRKHSDRVVPLSQRDDVVLRCQPAVNDNMRWRDRQTPLDLVHYRPYQSRVIAPVGRLNPNDEAMVGGGRHLHIPARPHRTIGKAHHARLRIAQRCGWLAFLVFRSLVGFGTLLFLGRKPIQHRPRPRRPLYGLACCSLARRLASALLRRRIGFDLGLERGHALSASVADLARPSAVLNESLPAAACTLVPSSITSSRRTSPSAISAARLSLKSRSSISPFSVRKSASV